MSAERTLPHNLDAERAVLGSVILNNDALAVAEGVLEAGDFFRDAHRRIFAAMVTLSASNIAIDLVTLKEALNRTGDLVEAGGPAYLAALIDGVPHSSNVRHYAELVKEAARLRAVIFTSNKALATAYEAEETAADTASKAADRLMAVAGDLAHGAGPMALREIAPEALDEIERSHASGKGIVTGLPSGIGGIDDLTAGFHGGQFVIIAARTSQGKTALALNIAQHIALRENVAGWILAFSLEMSKTENFMRMLAAEARVDSHRIRSGAMLSSADWGRISQAVGTLSEARILIDDSGEIGVSDIRARARKVKAERGLAMVIVDYIQLLSAKGQRYDSRSQEVGSFSRGLKRIARDLNVPVIALAQLNRESEARDGRKARAPKLSDLRESGDLEADADLVILIHRPDPESERAELIVAKQRNGPLGSANVYFDPASIRFSDLALPS